MDNQHQYTIVTPTKDVHLTTSNHHSRYDKVEDFLEAHKGVISTALGLASVALSGCAVYLGHFRKGAKIK